MSKTNYGKVALVAHRGYRGYHDGRAATENSLRAIQLASDQQFYYVEIDVQLTRDNELVLCHDDTFERVSKDPNNTMPISEMTLAQCKKIRLEDGTYVPSLQDALNAPARNEIHFFVDMKCGPGREADYCAAMCKMFMGKDNHRVDAVLSDNRTLLSFMNTAGCLPEAFYLTVEDIDFWGDINDDEMLQSKIQSCTHFIGCTFTGVCIPYDDKLYAHAETLAEICKEKTATGTPKTLIGIYNPTEKCACENDLKAIPKMCEKGVHVTFYMLDLGVTDICLTCKKLAIRMPKAEAESVNDVVTDEV